MKLTKQGIGKIDYVDFSWNPIKGLCLHHCSYCVDGNSLILMADSSWKKMIDIKIGDKIIGVKFNKRNRGDNRCGEFVETIVKNKMQRIAKSIELIVKNDNIIESIIISEDHRLLSSDHNKWTTPINFNLKTKLKGIKTKPELFKINDEYKKDWLSGMIDGDYFKIEAIKKIGERKLFDIETGSGNYILNGLISHNCYMAKISKRFKLNPEIRLDEKTLNTTFPKKPSRIFVASNHDVMGAWIPDKWIKSIIRQTELHPQHSFFFLTKNPARYKLFKIIIQNKDKNDSSKTKI